MVTPDTDTDIITGNVQLPASNVSLQGACQFDVDYPACPALPSAVLTGSSIASAVGSIALNANPYQQGFYTTEAVYWSRTGEIRSRWGRSWEPARTNDWVPGGANCWFDQNSGINGVRCGSTQARDATNDASVGVGVAYFPGTEVPAGYLPSGNPHGDTLHKCARQDLSFGGLLGERMAREAIIRVGCRTLRLKDYLRNVWRTNPALLESINNWEFCEANAVTKRNGKVAITGVGVRSRPTEIDQVEAFLVYLPST